MAGLRERKKARTRAAIAASAAELFARNGFRAVTMIEVAEAAEVSEQTVYNHFPTKESLVFDRAGELRAALLELDRYSGVVANYGNWLSAAVLGASAQRAIRNPGDMPRLVASDAGLRRYLLELADDWSSALAEVWVARSGERFDPVVARTLTDALLHVFVRAVDRLGIIETEEEIEALEADIRTAVNVFRPAFAALP
ncbi:TetR/AcrR family transcriptional regulator [Lentzea sp. NEAU-D13]|uniref:TetR/AcrR family transcriptional regulator n=1 Tax=Lentzea alba TaxID=2714351 RepID=A0A7C9VRJ8_9PSEU|nr:TetR/AcrR family transcriptional regulator [Lentzea alba]NGY57418.1 TetR/AcrR family transcriptional regulator [Lentzea alba]